MDTGVWRSGPRQNQALRRIEGRSPPAAYSLKFGHKAGFWRLFEAMWPLKKPMTQIIYQLIFDPPTAERISLSSCYDAFRDEHSHQFGPVMP
jgi:hypothetical protein